jgi:hypothetical protein
MRFRFSTAAALALLIACAPAAPAGAQDAAAPEFFAGYSYLRDPGSSVLTATTRDDSLRLGWMAGAARPLWRWVSAVVDASGHYKRGTTLDDDIRLSFHAIAAGPRGSVRIGRLGEFAQVLVGAAHARGSAFGAEVATTALTLQPGGGVDYALRPHLAARLQIDYRWIRGSDDGRDASRQLRAAAALVFR